MTPDYARSFFEFAEHNVKVASFLETRGTYYGSIYQLAQAFEKIIKSYYLLMKTKVEHNPAEEVYQNVIGIGHEIEDASLNLLIEIAQIEQEKFKGKADNPKGSSNAIYTKLYMLLSNRVSSYISTLQGFRNNQLDKNFLTNVRDYENFVKEKYSRYIKGDRTVKVNVNAFKLSEYGANYNAIINGIMNLYPCLYKMNDTARYPLNSFGYYNFWNINKINACDNVLIMVRTLIKKYKWVLENPYVIPD